jgi:hypothetical protein
MMSRLVLITIGTLVAAFFAGSWQIAAGIAFGVGIAWTMVTAICDATEREDFPSFIDDRPADIGQLRNHQNKD